MPFLIQMRQTSDNYTVAIPQISVILPTLNEALNLPFVIPRIALALEGRAFEILVIDDNSDDDTVAACGGLGKTVSRDRICSQKS